MLGPLRTVRTQIVRRNLHQKKRLRAAGGRGYERGRSPSRSAGGRSHRNVRWRRSPAEANAEPPQAVLDLLVRHKLSIVALLRSSQDGWTAEDWQARFDERAGFLEHDGGWSRLEAEVQAFDCCVVEWLNQHPALSQSGRCAWCGKPQTPSAVVLPFGAGEHHAWLHAECWPRWHQSRRVEAVMALRGMGITRPDTTMIDGVSPVSSAAERMRRYRERRTRGLSCITVEPSTKRCSRRRSRARAMAYPKTVVASSVTWTAGSAPITVIMRRVGLARSGRLSAPRPAWSLVLRGAQTEDVKEHK